MSNLPSIDANNESIARHAKNVIPELRVVIADLQSQLTALRAKVQEYLEARKHSDNLLWNYVNCEGDSSVEWEAYAPAATTTDDLSDALREMVK